MFGTSLGPLQLDFAHPAGRGFRFAPYILVLGALAASAAVFYQREMSQRLVIREARITELRSMASRSAPAIAARESDTPEVRAQVQKANGVLQQMNVPWGELFASVESAEGADVALLTVQPDPRSRSVTLAGVARSLPAVLGYMQRLERTKRLHDVVLASHEVKAKEPGQPVAFAVSASWVDPQ